MSNEKIEKILKIRIENTIIKKILLYLASFLIPLFVLIRDSFTF